MGNLISKLSKCAASSLVALASLNLGGCNLSLYDGNDAVRRPMSNNPLGLREAMNSTSMGPINTNVFEWNDLNRDGRADMQDNYTKRDCYNIKTPLAIVVWGGPEIGIKYITLRQEFGATFLTIPLNLKYPNGGFYVISTSAEKLLQECASKPEFKGVKNYKLRIEGSPEGIFREETFSIDVP